MKNVYRASFVAALLATALSLPSMMATAQVPSLPAPPYNAPISNPGVNTPFATKLITNTAQGAATVASNIISNPASKGIICTYNQVSHTGTPSTTIEVDIYDEASAAFQKIVQSGAITADATPTSILVYPGAALTTTPTGMVLEAIQLPRYFRVQEVVGGTATPTVTGTVGCELLR